MQSILILITWMALGALTSYRFGPSGAWPVAVMFGPLWLPIAVELQGARHSSQHDEQRRLEQLGFVSDRGR